MHPKKEPAQPVLRLATTADLPAIRELFRETALQAREYNEAQRRAWASGWQQAGRWAMRLESQYFLVAFSGETMAGFASLAPGGYIDLLYVRPDYQRQGLARALYLALEAKARRLGDRLLTTDASFAARPFFEKMGFTVERQQKKVILGVEISNFRMAKPL